MRTLLALGFLISQLAGTAQHPAARDLEDGAMIRYKASFNTDFERGRSFLEFHSVLSTGGRHSDFYMTPASDPATQAAGIEMLADVDTLFRVLKDMDEGMIAFSDIGLDGRVRHYLDTLHPMVWNLLPESKKIDDLECHKAVTVFKGRSYTAWYAPSIPIGNGPWKLGGLPGLIVEAYEDNMDMHFMLSSIRFGNQATPVSTGLLKQSQGIPGYPAFVAYWKNAYRMLQGSMAGRESPDCVSCHTNTSIRFYTWEKMDVR